MRAKQKSYTRSKNILHIWTLETAYNAKVQGVRADNGTEFVNSNLIGYFNQKV